MGQGGTLDPLADGVLGASKLFLLRGEMGKGLVLSFLLL